MRILQVNTEKTWRGGERQTLYTIEGLIDQGIDCQLMAIDGSLMHQKAKAIGIHVITVKSMSDALKKLANLKGDFDCIHAQTGKAHTQCILTKVFHRTPVIYTRRVNFTPRGFLTKLKYRLTNRIVSISYAISETLSTSGINQNSPVVYSAINHASIDIDRCIRLRKLLNLNKDTKIIGIISALESEKDPYTALSTINMLKNTRSDFSVLHFGDGSLFGSLSKSIEKLNLTKEYHQIGHVDNVEDFYSIMDVFFMTSKEEGLGSSVLDAFNHEASVVSTNAGGLQELVKDRGFLCNVGDIQCLSQGLNFALNLSQESVEYKVKAKRYCDNEMGIRLMASKYITLYKELMQGDKKNEIKN